MNGLRVLITNITLATRTGTELYVRDLATGLLARGYTPMVYSLDLGPIARELRAAEVTVVDDLRNVAPPDVIHGHHNLPAMQALLHFPGVPAVFFCHDSQSWHDSPPRSPRILRYVAVDLACRDRLVQRHGIPEERVRVLLNFVDLERFTPRGPLPPRPARALVFSNKARECTYVRAVREACARAGIVLDVVGAGVGTICENPEEMLGRYDLVFAKGRCALEAAAVGAAVIPCDAVGAGPMVTSGELDRLRFLNIGKRVLSTPVDPEVIVREIARYDPKDAAEVSRRIRATAGRDAVVDQISSLYREVIAEHASGGGYDSAVGWRAVARLQVLGWRFLRSAWLLDRRYGPMKYRVVLPASQHIKRLLRPQRAGERDSPSLAAGRRGS
jgi:hypothetical protein